MDELTLVVMLLNEVKMGITLNEWQDEAECIIDIVAERAEFERVFGEKRAEQTPVKGYKIAYTYGEHSFYFSACYHPYHVNMGIAIKFSAQSLAYYLEKSKLTVYEFLQKVSDDRHVFRLSRCDLTADYIDDGIDLTKVYQDLIDDNVGVFRESISKTNGTVSLRQYKPKLDAIVKDGDVETIYLGAPKSNVMMRIYNKKTEVLAHHGAQYDTAISCADWVRFEMILRHEYAAQFGNALLQVQNNDAYADLIASAIIQKFQFKRIDEAFFGENTVYTQMIMDAIKRRDLILTAPQSRRFDLGRNIQYMMNGSGMLPTLQKIYAIWGDDALDNMLSYIRECTTETEPNPDCNYWIRHNAAEYREHFTFMDFRKRFLS